MSRSARRFGWVVGLLCVVALLVVGSRPPVTSGVSQDRLYALGSQLKCLQCAGESVAGSQATIAVKMRSEIDTQMRKGATDDEILSFFADRYGPRVLLNPPGSGVAGLVWVIPVIALIGGGVAVASVFVAARRRRATDAAAELSAEDRELVESALRDGPDASDGNDA